MLQLNTENNLNTDTYCTVDTSLEAGYCSGAATGMPHVYELPDKKDCFQSSCVVGPVEIMSSKHSEGKYTTIGDGQTSPLESVTGGGG